MMRFVMNGTPDQPRATRETVHHRLHLLRRAALVASVLGFAGIWNLVAHHTVGVTARSTSPAVQPNTDPYGASSTGSSGYFGNGGGDGGSGGSGVGGGSDYSPVLGTGGS